MANIKQEQLTKSLEKNALPLSYLMRADELATSLSSWSEKVRAAGLDEFRALSSSEKLDLLRRVLNDHEYACLRNPSLEDSPPIAIPPVELLKFVICILVCMSLSILTIHFHIPVQLAYLPAFIYLLFEFKRKLRKLSIVPKEEFNPLEKSVLQMIAKIESRGKAPLLLNFITQTHLPLGHPFLKEMLVTMSVDLPKFNGKDAAQWSIGQKDGLMKIFNDFRNHKNQDVIRASLRLVPYVCDTEFDPFLPMTIRAISKTFPELKEDTERCNLEFIALENAKSESSSLLRASSKPLEPNTLLRPASGVSLKETDTLLRPSESHESEKEDRLTPFDTGSD